MKNILLLIVGIVVGMVISVFALKARTTLNGVADLHQNVIEAEISILDSLSKGDESTAKLLLASSINSHIVMWEKMSSSNVKNKSLSEAWRQQMSAHNAQSGLSLPNQK